MNSEYQRYIGQRADMLTSTDGYRFPATLPDIEGPYYLAGAPFIKDDLIENPEITINGRVLDRNGFGLGAREIILDFWQADKEGIYDQTGFKLRGKIKANSGGYYEIATIKPGHYAISETESRCSHIHVKVTREGFKPLTTQLYFPGDSLNEADHWFKQGLLLIQMSQKHFVFDFILERE